MSSAFHSRGHPMTLECNNNHLNIHPEYSRYNQGACRGDYCDAPVKDPSRESPASEGIEGPRNSLVVDLLRIDSVLGRSW